MQRKRVRFSEESDSVFYVEKVIFVIINVKGL